MHDDLGRWTVSGLAGCFEGWWPEPLRQPDRIRRWSLDAFAGLLDQPALAGECPLPPMWQVFGFLDHPAQVELGADGHPAGGHFLPPIPNRRRMFAGGRWRAYRPLRVGDEVTRTASVTSIEVKNGRSGEMAFVTVRYEFAQDGELAVVEEQDIVYRGGEPSEVAAPAPPAGAAPPARPTDAPVDTAGALRELRIAPDPPLLFRFSALTYNAHRIHYDHAYATGVEGYPGLVVHGPLLALLALELPRRADRGVTEFRYRLRRPAFAGATIVARELAPDPDGWSELTVGELDRPPSLTATVRYDAHVGAASTTES